MAASPLTRLLLLAYPPSIRRAHGPEILATASEAWRRSQGVWPRARLMLHLAGDAAWSWAPASRRSPVRSGRMVFRPIGEQQHRGHVRGGGFMQTVIQDLRYALRLFTRQRAFSVVAVLTLALAMGVSTTLFSVIDAAVIRPLPYLNPEQIVSATVATRRPGLGDRVLNQSASPAEMQRWQDSGVFLALAAWDDGGFVDGIIDGPVPERAASRVVTEGYFGLLGVSPLLGRGFTAEDTIPGAPPVVMLSHAYWRTRLGSDPNVVGTSIRYGGNPAVVVGILPAGFHPDTTVWQPMQVPPDRIDLRGSAGTVYGRLRAGLSIEDAERQLSAITPAADARSPAGETGPGRVTLTSVLDRTVAGYRTTVTILAAAVVLIVLIACVNVAGLLLARGATRQHELAIRASMGASRSRLIRQLLIESIALSLVGCAMGAVVAWGTLDALLAILPITWQSGVMAEINLRVLVAGAVFAVVTGVVFGLIPAVRLSRVHLGAALATGARRHGAVLSRRGGQYLIAAEMAMAVVLVVAGGLMVRSFERLTSVDLGFDPEAVVAFNVAPVEADAAVRAQYYPALLRAITALPGIEIAGAVDQFALGEGGFSMPAVANDTSSGVGVRQVLPGYFETMGFRLRQGRFLSEVDDGAVAVINESASRELFPDGAIGRQFRLGKTSMHTVIGVIADSRHGGPLGTTGPEVFLPFSPGSSLAHIIGGMTVVVRPQGRPADLTDSLRRAAEGVGPRVIVESIRPGNEWFGDRVATPRHRTALLGLLAAFGLMLTLVGIFSITAYAVTRRTHEIGVRMALGAQPVEVVGLMIRDAAWPMMLGLAGGLGAALYASRVVQSFLFETTPRDPLTFAAVALLLSITALAAAWLPARRAARVDPVATLRGE